MDLDVRRLIAGDELLAAGLFALMSEELGEERCPLAEDYLRRLLSRPDTWVVAAFHGREVVGGLTAHALPMTRAQQTELLVYDLAVSSRHRRRGVGRALVGYLVEHGLVGDAVDAFVLADDEDAEARSFYHALGGVPASTTMFTFGRRPPGSRRR